MWPESSDAAGFLLSITSPPHHTLASNGDKCINLFSPDVRVKTATELEVFAVVYSHICCVWNEENTIRYKIKITLPRYDSIQRPLRFRVALVFSVQNAQ